MVMKLLSLKLDDDIFKDTEEIIEKMNKARNRYINEAIELYNLYNKRKIIRKQYLKESKLVAVDSMKTLKEFEKLANEIQ